VTDDAMRAARDRWLADPESAGTGKAFEAGWSARDEEVARLRADLGTALAIIVVPSAYPDHYSPSFREKTEPRLQIAITKPQREWAIRMGGEYDVRVPEIRRAIEPPTPTGEATTGEGTE
jgi:hypothetical protein